MTCIFKSPSRWIISVGEWVVGHPRSSSRLSSLGNLGRMPCLYAVLAWKFSLVYGGEVIVEEGESTEVSHLLEFLTFEDGSCETKIEPLHFIL